MAILNHSIILNPLDKNLDKGRIILMTKYFFCYGTDS